MLQGGLLLLPVLLLPVLLLPVLLLLVCTGHEGCCQPSFKQVQAAFCELGPGLGTACQLCDAFILSIP